MAGYTTITVKGQEIGLRFGLRAIKRINQKLREVIANKDLDDDDKSISVLRDRLYSAYLCDCMYRDVQPVIPVEDFTDYVENAALSKNTEELVEVFRVYQDSIDALPKVETEDEKKNPKTKKSIGMKQKSFVKEETGTLTRLHGESLSYSAERMTENGLSS